MINWPLLLAALIAVESGGNHDAVGDLHLQNKAYGILQIRKPYLEDVNRIAGTSVTMEQVRKSKTVSRWATVVYLRHYGKVYERKTGKKPTYEVYARIHNGGPNGWKKSSTDAYWKKVKEKLE
jgi:hypothetical protein